MAKTQNDPKARLALSTPAIKRALKAAAIRNNKIGVALGVAKPIQSKQASGSHGGHARHPVYSQPSFQD